MQMPVVDNRSSNTLDDIMYKTYSCPKNNFGFVLCVLYFHFGLSPRKKSSTTTKKMVTLMPGFWVSVTRTHKITWLGPLWYKWVTVTFFIHRDLLLVIAGDRAEMSKAFRVKFYVSLSKELHARLRSTRAQCDHFLCSRRTSSPCWKTNMEVQNTIPKTKFW